MDKNIQKIVDKAIDGKIIKQEDIGALFSVPVFSEESYLVQWAGRKMSVSSSSGKAEIHAQVGLNIAPCPNNCLFCSFAKVNKVFNEKIELSVQEVIKRCIEFETDGANAIYLMSTADFPFERFLKISVKVREKLKDETVMIANIGDFNAEQAKSLKETGYTGIYHAVRMGEGKDTMIDPQKRLKTFQAVQNAGLLLGTCVEPVGNEHTVDELVEKTLITRNARPVYSGAARRISIPGSMLEPYGTASEAKLAHIVAVVRLAMGYSVPGNCTHEPNSLGVAAGANLLWAEVGSNPRDHKDKTEYNRGLNVRKCKELFNESEWDVLSGPSEFYQIR